MYVFCEMCKTNTFHTPEFALDGIYVVCTICGAKEVDELIDFDGHKRGGDMIWRSDKDKSEEHTCMGCKTKFFTGLTGAWAEICLLCREEFDVSNQQEADELLELFRTGVVNYVPPSIRGRRGSADKKKKTAAVVPFVPKVDAAVVAAALRSSIDYKVTPVETWEKPITYAMAKNGLFEVRHSDLCTIVSKPKEVLGLTEELKEGITLNLPKIPFDFLRQTISFFRGVCARHKGSSEALVQVWWDRETQQHVMHVPEQTVSGASVNHRSTFDQGSEGRWFHVADIHSHGSSMSAFWSGTDNRDEERVTTERLFGVIGKVEQSIPEWKWRMRTSGSFVDLVMADVFAIPEQEYTFCIKGDALWRSVDQKDNFKDGRVNLSCPVTSPFENVEVPAAWYEQVKGYAYGVNGQQQHGSFHRPHYPQVTKGFLYIDGREYEIDDKGLKATGHKLITQEDTNRDAPKH